MLGNPYWSARWFPALSKNLRDVVQLALLSDQSSAVRAHSSREEIKIETGAGILVFEIGLSLRGEVSSFKNQIAHGVLSGSENQ